MYITYCRNQKTVDLEDKTNYRLSVTGGDYRPTWLLRVSDWEKVPGTAAVDGYHTISYCWEQSGEVVRNETDGNNNEYSLVDNGYHCIVEGYKLYQDDTYRMVNISHPEDEEDYYTEYISWCEPKSESASIRYVTYEELLQQVCKDFQVEYVWYDKICIDQSDPKAKSREIKQMHKIYHNARYAIAMVPEVRLYDPKDFDHAVYGSGHKAQDSVADDVWSSFWWKRSWTLEEVMMTRRILIVGTDTNMFQHSLNTSDIPTTVDVFSKTLLDFGGTEHKRGSVNQALAFAHLRTSTKPHDMIFALKNTFFYMFDDMETSYSMDIKTTFNNFYRHVATKDFSILCFGSTRYIDGSIYLKSTMDDYNLPSWTGVAGRHIENRVTSTTHAQLEYHIDEAMCLHITTPRYWKISITPYDNGCYSSSKDGTKDTDAYLENINRMSSTRFNDEWIDMTKADKDSLLMEWFLNLKNATSLFMTHYHQRHDSSLTQIRPLTLTEDCEDCIILPILLQSHAPMNAQPDPNVSNFLITDYDQSYCLPVLRECTKGTGRYKIIGIYYVGDHDNLCEPTFKWNHFIGVEDIHTNDPKEIVNALFQNDDHNTVKKFIIE